MRRHLYFYTLLDGELTSTTARFADDPSLWLPAPAERQDNGFVVELSADGALPRSLARHRVIVDVGPTSEQAGRLMRTLTWRSATAPGIFPVFDGDIELVGLHGEGSQLSLMGAYRPPLSVAGTAGDALLGHSVAEACVRRFVLDAGERMVGVTLGA